MLPIHLSVPRSMAEKKVTRQETEIFGLGSKICTDDAEIKGARLPTCRQVLRCFMFQNETGNTGKNSRKKWESAKLVFQQVSVFYAKAHIPMIAERKACEKILNLVSSNAKFREIPKARRSSPDVIAKIEEHEIVLCKTFGLWPSNVEKLIQNEDDLKFLISMKSDRRACFGSFDSIMDGKVKRKLEREKAHEKRKMAEEHEMKLLSSVKRFRNSEEGDSSDCHDSEFHADTSDSDGVEDVQEVQRAKRKHVRKYEGTSAFIPPDILTSPNLTSLATRLKIKPAAQSAFVEKLIEECGGDKSKVCTSYATADKYRRKVGGELAKAHKELWLPPKIASLHWDGKQLNTLTNQYEKEERLGILVGDSRDMKLLGIPSYKSSDLRAGEIISQRTGELVRSWQCETYIKNMVFDTTSSNTGHLTAACIAIQSDFKRALLWSACRRHVGEIILTHSFDALQIEPSKSPEVTLFTRLRSSWPLLPHDTVGLDLQTLDMDNIPLASLSQVSKWRLEALELMRSKLELHRDDYREFIELCSAFLDPEQTVKFKRPGACHKARWMAKLLYSLKIVLLEDQIAELPLGTIVSRQQVSKIRDFVSFVTLLYSTWWINCPCVVDAPFNDLEFYQNLLKYRTVNQVISDAATKAMKNHLWYLTSEFALLALFSQKVSKETRRKLADELLRCKPENEITVHSNRYGNGYGKPTFPQITENTELPDLVDVDSWYTVSLLELDMNFLSENVDCWEISESYIISLHNVNSLNFTNDPAERAVKLSADFASSARSEEHYQNVVQVVEADRKALPNIRIRNSNNQ